MLKMINKRTHRFNAEGSMIAVFLSVAIVYFLHYICDGKILSSRLLTMTIFSCFIFIFLNKKWPWNKLESYVLKEHYWVIVGLISAILISSIYLGRQGFPGDYNVHKQFALHLLNGNQIGHRFYKGSPGFYPQLSHASLAIIENFTGLAMHHCYQILSVITGLVTSFFSYKLARQLGFSKWISLFFNCMICLYGGLGGSVWREYFLYLPGLQLSMPFITRNMVLALFFILLNIIIRTYRTNSFTGATAVSIGMVLGLAGLLHPLGILVDVSLIAIIGLTEIIRRKFDFKIISFFSLSIIFGVAIAGLHYIPAIARVKYYDSLSHVARLNEMFPWRPFFYSPLPYLAIFAFWPRRKREGWIHVILMLISLVFLGRYILGIFVSFDEDEWVIFRLNRVGPYLFTGLALLACQGCGQLTEVKYLKRPVSILLLATVSLGLYSNYNSLNSWKEVRLNRFKHIFSKELFPERGIEKLRFEIGDKKKTIIVRPEISDRLACEAGIHVSYSERGVVFKRHDEEALSQEERFQKVEEFYDLLDKGMLNEKSLDYFETDMFVDAGEGLEKKHGNLSLVDSVEIDGNLWYLYKLSNEVLSIN